MLEQASCGVLRHLSAKEKFYPDAVWAKADVFPAVSSRALLQHFRVNLSGIAEALIDQITILSFFVFANEFDDHPYNTRKQNQRGE
jgi:hypothetical protein